MIWSYHLSCPCGNDKTTMLVTLLYIVNVTGSGPIWLNAQDCSTVFTQTQEEDALIDTNQEAFKVLTSYAMRTQ